MNGVRHRWAHYPRVVGWAAEGALFLALVLLAAAVRLPHFDTIPRFTDEVREVWSAVGIAFHGERPLVHDDAYRGAHWAYLLAAWLRLAGGGPTSPRLFALLIGSLTVGATYALGRTVAGRRAGILAAALMATAFGHVVLISHVAWANHSTPLWTTSAVGCLYLDRRRNGGWLAAAATFWGLALASHPSAMLPFAGSTVWWLIGPERYRALRQPGAWSAAAILTLVVSPLLFCNVAHGLPALAQATRPAQPVERHLTVAHYGMNLISLAGQLGRLAGAGARREVGEPVPTVLVRVTDALRPWLTFLYGALLSGALAAAFHRPGTGRSGAHGGFSASPAPLHGDHDLRLLALSGGSGLLIMPAILGSYENFYDMRYLGFILPLACTALGAGVVRLASRHSALGRLATAGVLSLALISLGSIGAYYTRETNAGRTNGPLLAAAERVSEAARRADGYVFVDKAMRPIKLGGGGDPTGAFQLLLALRGVDFQLADVTEMRWFLLADPAATFCLIAADTTRDELAREFALVELQAADGWSAACRQSPGRWVGEKASGGNPAKR